MLLSIFLRIARRLQVSSGDTPRNGAKQRRTVNGDFRNARDIPHRAVHRAALYSPLACPFTRGDWHKFQVSLPGATRENVPVLFSPRPFPTARPRRRFETEETKSLEVAEQ